MKLPTTLALRELRHDWQAAACFVAALVGVLAPFLIILALKNGAIDALLGRLVEDPSNREIIALGAGDYDGEFFDEMRAREDVLFVTPKTRSINAQANIVRHRQTRSVERRVSLIPSAPGDPISPDADVAPGRVVLSSRLAEALNAGAGDTVEIRIDRRIDTQLETARRDVAVAGVVPPERYGRAAMFISIEDMVAIERFRDDASITPETWTDPAPLPESYASFRLYARALDDIGTLERHLTDLGKRSRLRVENVDLLLSFQRNLNLLFAIIAGLAVVGFWAAMASNLRGSVERQRTSLSLLNLLGMSEQGRRLIPVTQSVILVTSGVIITLGLVLPMLFTINRFFTPDGFEQIARLGPTHIFYTLSLGLLTAITASGWAVFAIKDIKADEVLRTS